jgi:predicted Mrr-cat superfamily restriction endonuclease
VSSRQIQNVQSTADQESEPVSTSAFVLRISSGDPGRIKEALADNQISIGWSVVKGLLDPSLTWEEARKKIKQDCYPDEKTYRRAGAATGQVWLLFIKRMKEGDLVVVPHSDGFLVAKVSGPAIYREDKIDVDEAYRRDVVWLNDKKPIPRTMARSALISRMKTYNTCVSAGDLLESIQECLALAEKGESPTFQADLQKRLVKETLDELQKGRMDSCGFERLIRTSLIDLGAKEAKIVARSKDKGADIVATFYVAGAFVQKVAVQAKHWQQSRPPVGPDVVKQLIQGIEAEEASLGMVITSGKIDDDARKEAEQYSTDTGINIELVDGEEFAKIIVENGIRLTARV